jgi:hypothetical protein
MANSDTNVGPVHCILTGVYAEHLSELREKNLIINTNHLIYKPTNALNKIQ